MTLASRWPAVLVGDNDRRAVPQGLAAVFLWPDGIRTSLGRNGRSRGGLLAWEQGGAEGLGCLGSAQLPKPEGSLCSQQISGKYFIPKHWRTLCLTPPLIQVRALGCIGMYWDRMGAQWGWICSPLRIELSPCWVWDNGDQR